MSDYEDDRRELLSDLNQSRGELVSTVQRLGPEDFGNARRGSWTISKILDHVLHSERLYTQLVCTFGGKPATAQDAGPVATADEAEMALNKSREAFLQAVEEVTEEDFYRLQTIGHEEYSILSILENNAAHDREHAEQIAKTLSG
jgi:uncharacterized damage-inducible protein DinB